MIKETRNVGWKDISIEIIGPKDGRSSDNKYFNVHFLDQNDSSKYTLLHIWFSYQYLNYHTEGKKTDFNKLIPEDITEILEEAGYDIFNKEEHFIFYSMDWRQYGRSFSMD